MQDASAIVLQGFEIGVDDKPIEYPGRYMDEDGREMWDFIKAEVNLLGNG